MTLRELVVALWRGGFVIALCAAGFAAAAAASTQIRPSLYYATSAVVVTTPPGAVWSGAANTSTVIETRRATYAGLVKTEQVVAPVVAALGIEHSPTEFARRIVVSSNEGVGVIRISVTDTDPQLAVDASNALAQTLASVVQSIEAGTPTSAPANAVPAELRMVDVTQALPPGYRAGPGTLMTVALGFVLGTFVGCWVVVFRDTVAPRVYDAEDVYEATGLPVLGRASARSAGARLPVDRGMTPTQWEQFRALATRVRVLDRQAILLAGTDTRDSGAPAVAWMLAIALAESGHRVVVVDAGSTRGRQAGSVPDRQTRPDIPAAHADVAATTEPSGTAGVHVMRPVVAPDRIATDDIAVLLGLLLIEFDFVVCISRSVLDVAAVGSLARVIGTVVLTVESGHTRARDLREATVAFRTARANVAGVVITRTRWWPPTTSRRSAPTAPAPRSPSAALRHGSGPHTWSGRA